MNLLFDLDGTLIDSASGIQWSAKKTFEELALPLPTLENIPIGPPILNTIKNHLGSYSDSHFEEARKKYQKIYREEGIRMFSVYENINEVLVQLSSQKNRLYRGWRESSTLNRLI